MFRVFISLTFYLLFSWQCAAFNADYKSVNSSVTTGLSSIRDIYNSPYSLCEKDRIRIIKEHCGRISLMFGDPVFREVYLLTDWAKKEKPDFWELTESEARTVINNYYIPSYLDKPWSWPTLGQLDHAFDEGYIAAADGTPHWIWDSNAGKPAIVYRSSIGAATQRASLQRAFTPDYPSNCSQNQCSGWAKRTSFTLYVYRDNSAHSMGYEIAWEDAAGYHRTPKYYTGSSKTFTFKPDTTKVWVHYCKQNTGDCGHIFALDLSRVKWNDPHPRFCVQSHGSVFKTWTSHWYQGHQETCTRNQP